MNGIHFSLPEKELLHPGHQACQGCGAAIAMRHVLKGLDENTIVVIPACCWTIVSGAYPYSVLKVPVLHTAFETAAVTACGVKAGLEIQGDTRTRVMAWAGDGGTFDIGLQSLSGAAERNEDILYVCYDNEAYMNTGIQRSSATPRGAWTTTTPTAKQHAKKDIMQIMAAHHVPYAATASIAFPDDLVAKVTKASQMSGLRFIHLLSPCPPGWKTESEMTVKLARLAVKTRVFPLYEIDWGERYTLTQSSPSVPVAEYLRLQGRFAELSDSDIAEIQRHVNDRWNWLVKMAETFPGTPSVA